ncbi:MAG: argininosuccinate lyase [Actinomycetota bacterium]|nr:argininosuccinate lyase [Actinomycetota bacterium]
MKLWGGRFLKNSADELTRFSRSISFDTRLGPYETRVLGAWADELFAAGYLNDSEKKSIKSVLKTVEDEIIHGTFVPEDEDEDIHTAIERRVINEIGQTGGKLRLGRSRNDLVATDTRLLVMTELECIHELLLSLEKTILSKAKEVKDIIIPGHTHLQPAQPVLLSHVLLSFAWMLERDRKRITFARNRADSMPLGSGALAGTSIEIDRERLAHKLGFSELSENSVDAVSDRDFVSDALYALAMIMIHLSRIAEQFVLWYTEEFSTAKLDEEWCTGSSIMPQKKNPDIPELVRGKSGRVIGDLVSILVLMKGLPFAYNRDMQEDKERLFDAIDTASSSVSVMKKVIEATNFDKESATRVLRRGYICATDLADYLAKKGVDFSTAHELVGEIVKYCESERKQFESLTIPELKKFSELFEDDALLALDPHACVEARKARGGTAPDEVERQIGQLEKNLVDIEGPVC